MTAIWTSLALLGLAAPGEKGGTLSAPNLERIDRAMFSRESKYQSLPTDIYVELIAGTE